MLKTQSSLLFKVLYICLTRLSMTTDYIIEIVCKSLCLDRDKLISDNKHRIYSDGRFIAMFLIRQRVTVKKYFKKYGEEKLRMPYKQIAYIFKKGNHGTAMHAETECKTLIKTDKEFKKKYDMVVNTLDSNVSIA